MKLFQSDFYNFLDLTNKFLGSWLTPIFFIDRYSEITNEEKKYCFNEQVHFHGPSTGLYKLVII